MDYGKVALTEDDYEKTDKFGVKLLVAQGLLLVLSLAAFSVCIWMRFDLDFWAWCLEIEWYSYWYCTYVVMIGMLLKALTLGLGAFAVWISSRALLLTCAALHPILFALHLTGVILICIYGTEESSVLTDELEEVFWALIYEWDNNPRKSRIHKQIMEYVGCCGSTGGSDFSDVYKPIPTECRHPITGNEWDNGCGQQMAFWLEPWSATVASIGIFLCLTDILLTYYYLRHRSKLNDQKQ